ncbi:nucleoside-diphosphate sugar epimerase/dehydratase [Synechococcus sp. CBW1006]|uniref:polysaccharide biosynthesis protein n=1 Tax=Synechococcus sp. CBW1006 TaxID=1353138 RepID=UPI0018CFDDAD|nr:nucleoside-diphosphate sugar epimerase/dehydratase [Synechococcus sp. CBW1006]QPN65948.1 polysaccharide biosynthesis protein [Synechococcus sp. CBW1006]
MPVFQLSARLLALPPLRRRLLLISADALLIPLVVWLSFALRLSEFWPQQLQACLWLFPLSWLVALPLYGLTGQYKGITRYAGSRVLYAISARNLAVVLVLHTIEMTAQWPAPPQSSWFLLWFLLTGLTGLVRLALRDVLHTVNTSSRRRRQVGAVIYGAGSAGVQLAAALRYAHSHRVVGFLDDDPQLWNRYVNGIPVLAPQRLAGLIERHRPSQILLAMPKISRSERRRIIDGLQPYRLPVLQVPSVDDITSCRTRIDALRPIAIEELLGRDPVPPDLELLQATVAGRSVLVTGAGGSIGSELCRQILALGPARLLLLERSEPALYTIDQELQQQLRHQQLRHQQIQQLDLDQGPDQGPDQLVVPLLGSVTDRALLDQLFADHPVQVVFHAAAYKHVPLVEGNPLAGLANNVAGTRTLLQAAIAHGVERLVFISTDKAVRPTNVMGASKRLAEQILQAMAQELALRGSLTVCALVRFGNVLGSSGSVVPLFRRQIDAGGPITLTHPDVIRYFMTIPEAVQLVLQASALAQGGDCFLLDMGEPIRILDLARQMVALSGLSLRDDQHPNGDIAIACTGLRPGEKLYEELLIDAESQPTSHPLIYRAQETFLEPCRLWPLLDALEWAVARHDQSTALDLLARLVPEWQRSAPPRSGADRLTPDPSSGPRRPDAGDAAAIPAG